MHPPCISELLAFEQRFTHLRADLLPLKVAVLTADGFWTAEDFLVTKVTPPFSPEPGWTPTALALTNPAYLREWMLVRFFMNSLVGCLMS